MFLLFILLCITEFIILCICSENKSWWISLISICATFAIVHLWIYKGSLLTIKDYVLNNPLQILEYIGLYVVAGIVWSFYKWYVYLKKNVEKLKERGTKSTNFKKDYSNIFDASENKESIIAWMIYWPFSAFWYIISDPITKFYKWLFEKFSGIYENITNSVLKTNSNAVDDKNS